MNKILITGAGGYIGSVAAYLFLQNNYEVVAIDNFSTGNRAPLKLLHDKYGKDKFRFYEFDLRDDMTEVFEIEKKVDAIIHYAAACLVDESMKKPIKYFNNNICGVLNLLKHMQENQINNIVFSSTCAVYGEADYVPIDEKHPTSPNSPYGDSKRIIERILEWQSKQSDLKYMVLRYFNVCGASEDGLIGDSKKPSVLLVQNTIRGALDIEPFKLTCPEVDTPDKTPIRDYVNVLDLNEAHVKAVEYLLGEGKSDVINLGTGTGNSVLEIVDKVNKELNVDIPLEKTTPREGEYAKMIADIGKAKKILGWKPKRSIEDSISSLVKWYKKHPHGWER
jgi:UDP-glucose 4-epimerase